MTIPPPRHETTRTPDQQDKLYLYQLYRDFYWGPFEDADAIVDFIKDMDAWDSDWDQDPFSVYYGSATTPGDGKHRFVGTEIMNAIIERRYSL